MAILLAASGFFSGSETALFSLTFEQRRDLRRRSDRRARSVIRLLEDPSSLLATILFGNMLVNIFYFSVSTMAALELRRLYNAGAVAAFGAISLGGIVLFGEVLPKITAVNISVPFSLLAGPPLVLLRYVLMPVHYVLVRVVQSFARLFRLHALREERITPEELKMLVELSEQNGVISRSERELIAEVVEFGQIRIAEVMTPRVDVPAFEVNEPIADLRKLLLETQWRKVPVYEDNIDNILGIVHAKEVLLSDGVDVRSFIREVTYVPSLAQVEKVLRQFREKQVHFAIAVDEFGGFDGVVTVEDILEEIVGEIETEFEEEGPLVEQIGPTEYRLAGTLSIREWKELFNIEGEFPGFDTIGGLVMLLLGHIPREGESVDFGQLTFTIERMWKRKIVTIILKTRSGG